MIIIDLVLVLVLGLEGLVLVLVLGCLVFVLVLGLECLVLVLVLGLEGQVLVNITGSYTQIVQLKFRNVQSKPDKMEKQIGLHSTQSFGQQCRLYVRVRDILVTSKVFQLRKFSVIISFLQYRVTASTHQCR